MNIFRTAVFVAALAGLCAGVVMTGLQSFFTVPLILKAEVFETAAPAHDHESVAGAAQAREEPAWEPAEGLERTAFTGLANIVTATGFALVLVAFSELAGGAPGWRRGLLWGLAGFAVFTLAPGLGLPPELPAMPSADLAHRQTWWAATAFCTAAALYLLAFRRSSLTAAIAVALVVAPHLLGAPQPSSHESPIPADLHRGFVIAVFLTSFVYWLVLGAAVGALRSRFASNPARA